MQPIAGRSNPSVSTMQLQTTFGLAGCQPCKDRIPLGLGCAAVDVLGATPDFTNSSLTCTRVRDVDAKHQRLSALAKLVPIADDIADEIVAVHAVGELTDDIIALARFDALRSGLAGA